MQSTLPHFPIRLTLHYSILPLYGYASLCCFPSLPSSELHGILLHFSYFYVGHRTQFFTSDFLSFNG